MIEINLLPLESFRQKSSGQRLVAIFSVSMILLAAVLFTYYSIFMGPSIEELEKAQQSATQELNKAKGQTNAALKKTTDVVADMVKVSFISELEERRRDQARLLMGVADEVINEVSWLVSCSHDKGVVRVKGMATDHEVVAKFLSNLQGLPILQNVELLRAAEDTIINGIGLVSFEISANTVFGESSLMTAGLPSEALPPKETLIKMVTLAAPNLAEALKPKVSDKKKL
jgi:Tfp pilus assembly protein PilN